MASVIRKGAKDIQLKLKERRISMQNTFLTMGIVRGGKKNTRKGGCKRESSSLSNHQKLLRPDG